MGLRKVIKQSWETTWGPPIICGLIALVVLLAIGFIGIGFFQPLLKDYNQYFAGVAAGVSAVVVAVLVGVTIMYARATKRQADTSAEMADEMREQRYKDSLPLLVPDITFTVRVDPNELDYGLLQTGQGIKVMWRNAGKGVAINSRFSFYPVPTSSGKADTFPPHSLGTLAVGGKKELNFDRIFERYNRKMPLLNAARWHQISDTYRPRLEAKYQDIYEREIATVQELRVDEQNKRAFLGELYFTINGRRLGQEVTRHD